MNRSRVIVAWAVFLATFLWLWFPVEGPGPWALWPSAVAVGLAFVTRDIYLSLFLGAFSGAILLRQGNLAGAFLDLPARYLLPALQNPWNLSVLVFTLMMGGFVELLNRQGGMAALADWFLGRSRTRRRAGLGVFILGWVMFIDGLANAMLVGRTMRPITDRARMSREKLAFIVDSTSSPIAGLALISTWVAYEMSVIREGFENLGDPARWGGVAPFQMLVESLPFRFYNYLVLWIVFLTIWLGRDYGPMLKAERRVPAPPEGKAPVEEPGETRSGRVFVALLPLMVLIFVVFGGLYVQGGGLEGPWTMANMIAAFGRADAALVFVCATAFAVVVAMLVGAVFPNGRSEGGMARIFLEGMNRMFPPALILVFAWMLNAIIQ
jgi:Na+/H+ antiporter NhaC